MNFLQTHIFNLYWTYGYFYTFFLWSLSFLPILYSTLNCSTKHNPPRHKDKLDGYRKKRLEFLKNIKREPLTPQEMGYDSSEGGSGLSKSSKKQRQPKPHGVPSYRFQSYRVDPNVTVPTGCSTMATSSNFSSLQDNSPKSENLKPAGTRPLVKAETQKVEAKGTVSKSKSVKSSQTPSKEKKIEKTKEEANPAKKPNTCKKV